jgi:hypothetical protein
MNQHLENDKNSINNIPLSGHEILQHVYSHNEYKSFFFFEKKIPLRGGNMFLQYIQCTR